MRGKDTRFMFEVICGTRYHNELCRCSSLFTIATRTFNAFIEYVLADTGVNRRQRIVQ